MGSFAAMRRMIYNKSFGAEAKRASRGQPRKGGRDAE